MPYYRVPLFEALMRVNMILLDTNVLVAAFLPSDANHERARLFLEEYGADRQFVVSICTVVESWGVLVGSKGEWPGGFELLAWLSNPGNPLILLPQHVDGMDGVRDITSSQHVDCVDALLSCLADEITRQCGFTPHLSIATWDTAHLHQCRRANGLKFRVLDMRTFEEC